MVAHWFDGYARAHVALIKDGVFAPNELITKGAATMLDELHRWAEALKPLRAA